MKPFNEYFRQVFFFLILLALGSVIFLQVRFLVPGFLGAVTLYVLNRKLYFHLIFGRRWNKYIATLLLVIIDAVLLAIPFAVASAFVAPRLSNFYSSANELLLGLKEIIAHLSASIGFEIISDETLNNLPRLVASIFPQMLGTAVNAIVNVLFVFFLLFFMMTNAQKMESVLLKFLPLTASNKRLVTSETKNIVTSYALGIPALALSQGFVAVIGYKIFGVKDAVLWGFVTCICSVIPIVGSGLIWIPLAGFLYAHGHGQAALGLTFYCLVIVVNVDNVLRLFLLKAFADIHPLITLFGVITGLRLFGFIGLIFGPLLVSYLLLLIRIYVNEFSEHKTQGSL
jgi:predicted PurR-regulated permease PerM